MRIDLNYGPQAAPEGQNNASQKTAGAGNGANSSSTARASSLGEDLAQLSGAHAQVQSLAAQASQLPEIRQERVQALRHAVSSGQYHASPVQVAGALFAHMAAQRAA